jgi:hypothetical protein
MNNKNIDNNPLIFIKKINDKHKIIPLKKTIIVLGANRHFPPATREWYNSIYTYNNNSMKNLSRLDKILNYLIESYLNLYFKNKFLNSNFISKKFNRLSFIKIHFSKPDLKHTSSKVVITLHIYNEEQRYLNSKLENILDTLYPKNKIILGYKYTFLSLPYNNNNFYYVKDNLSLETYLENIYLSICKRIYKENIGTYKEYKKLIKDIYFYLSINTIEDYKNLKEAYEYIIFYSFYEKNIQELSYYKLLLNLNKSKFENNFLSKLTSLMRNLYNKAIEFNVIDLKTMNLNSDIFTKAIALKLKNRDNNLINVLRYSLSMIKLPLFFRIKENYKKLVLRELLINRANNLYNKSVINKCNDYTLNKLLYNLLPNSFSNITNKKYLLKKKDNLNKEIEKIIFSTLKYKNIYGARLEAKGRLTKRFTASRSLFKLRWKGSLKNIDASYRGWSTVILRNNLKSNLQYSLINSKTRVGAFGLKGWVSTK